MSEERSRNMTLGATVIAHRIHAVSFPDAYPKVITQKPYGAPPADSKQCRRAPLVRTRHGALVNFWMGVTSPDLGVSSADLRRRSSDGIITNRLLPTLAVFTRPSAITPYIFVLPKPLASQASSIEQVIFSAKGIVGRISCSSLSTGSWRRR
jgi:hypothetical protein